MDATLESSLLGQLIATNPQGAAALGSAVFRMRLDAWLDRLAEVRTAVAADPQSNLDAILGGIATRALADARLADYTQGLVRDEHTDVADAALRSAVLTAREPTAWPLLASEQGAIRFFLGVCLGRAACSLATLEVLTRLVPGTAPSIPQVFAHRAHLRRAAAALAFLPCLDEGASACAARELEGWDRLARAAWAAGGSMAKAACRLA